METTERPGLKAGLVTFAVLLTACAGPAAPPIVAEQPPPAVSTDHETEAPILAEAPTPAPEPPAALPPEPEPFLTCSGSATQGGAIVCRTLPGARVSLDGKPVAIAAQDGVAVVGLRRDATSPAKVTAAADEAIVGAEVEVKPRKDTVSKLSMECNKIAAQSPAEKRHAEVSWVKKDKAWNVFAEPLAPLALIKPAEGPYSSPFGATRTYVPKTKDCEGSTNVHNGQDIAIPTGTEIRAPMAGTVTLADPDLYYEGGAVFLDLGRGLLSITMHMSRIDVKPGDVVKQGDVLGLSGATGRVTGPHLHWAIRYRNVNSEDRGTDIWLDPVLLLDVKQPE